MPVLEFNRIYSINFNLVATSGTLSSLLIKTPVEGEEDYEGLQMTLKANVSSNSTGIQGQQSTLCLYNLSDAQKDLLTSAKEGFVIIKAGYGIPFNADAIDSLNNVLIADVMKSYTTREGNDFVTKVTLQAGRRITKAGLISRTFNAGTTVGTVAMEIARSFNTSLVSQGITDYPVSIISNLPDNIKNKVIRKARVASGFTSEVLEDFLKQYECSWTVENNIIYLLKNEGEAAPSTKTITVSPDSVKGRVESLTDNSKKNIVVTPDTLKKVRLTTFLEPRIDLQTTLKLEPDLFKSTQDLSGDYKVVRYRLNLDYRGRAWDTITEAQEVKSE